MSPLGRVAPKLQPNAPAPTPPRESGRPQSQDVQHGREVLQQVVSKFSPEQRAGFFNKLNQGHLPNPTERLSHLVGDLEAGRVSPNEFAHKAEGIARSVNVDGKLVDLPSASDRMHAMREALDGGRLGGTEAGACAEHDLVESYGDASTAAAGETSASRFLDAATKSHESEDNLQATDQTGVDAELNEEQLDLSHLFALDASADRAQGTERRRSSFPQMPASLSEEEQVLFEQLHLPDPDAAQPYGSEATATRSSDAKQDPFTPLQSEDVSLSSGSMPEGGSGAERPSDREGSSGGERASDSSGSERSGGGWSRSSATVVPFASALRSSAMMAAAGSASRFGTAASTSGTTSRSRASNPSGTTSKSRAASLSGTASKSSAAISDEIDLGEITSLDLSPTEQELYDKLEDEDPAAAAKFKLQQKLAKIAELAALLSNIAKMRHDTAMAIIGNMKG